MEEDQLTADSGSDGDQDAQVAPSAQIRSKADKDAAQEPPAKRARTGAKGMSKARWTGLAKVSLVRPSRHPALTGTSVGLAAASCLSIEN